MYSLKNVILVCLLYSSLLFSDNKKILIIGDSTVSNYKETSLMRGWGQVFSEYFNDNLMIHNKALPGASTKTYLNKNRWNDAIALNPDYVLIQFGHNDSHAPEKPESTNAQTDYKVYLKKYINESREIKAKPILVTPMHRRIFNKGKILPLLDPYAKAMHEVGKEMNVPVVKLHEESGIFFQSLGEEKCIPYFFSKKDRTHFSEKGAKVIAKMVAKRFVNECPELKNYYIKM